MEVRKVFVDSGFGNLVPVVTFYTPMLRGDQQYLLVSKPSGEVGGEEGGDGEKTIDQAQLLFDNGSNATNEGDFVNTFECISLDHDIGVLRYREVALGCASSSTFDKYGCAYKAQEVNDSVDGVTRSAPNEELVKGTASEDDAGDSKASGSSVEDTAPSSEKGFHGMDKFAPDCARTVYTHGCALLYEAQEVTDPLGDFHNTEPNEESVKSTVSTSKDDAGNSKTSSSNVKDVAQPS